MGPLTSREGSKKKVTQSIDLNAQHHLSGFSSAGKSFSHLSEVRSRQVRRNRLPKIKVLNKKSVNELVVSLKEVETNRKLIE